MVVHFHICSALQYYHGSTGFTQFPLCASDNSSKKGDVAFELRSSHLEYGTHALPLCRKGASNGQMFTALLSLPFLLGINFDHRFSCIYPRCNCIAQSQGCSDEQKDQKRTAVLVQFSALGRPLACCFSLYRCSFSVPKSQFPEEKVLCLNV